MRQLISNIIRFLLPYVLNDDVNIISYTYIIIIGIQPLGRFGQRPELSHATDTALVFCIMGKFLGVVCHCFPPRLDVPTLATRCVLWAGKYGISFIFVVETKSMGAAVI